ncbi:hypothetical protein CPC08DRAFT_624895 [Agrocybe pediades]|nr:hypothetical protein CPC08DRAFT_624895 [Agrocybe pediades]
MGPNFSGVTALEQGKGVGTSYLARWTIFKWCLLISVLTVFGYGCAGLISALMTWFNAWEQAEVLTVTDNDILILLTLAGTLTLVTACIGIAGTLLNSRPVLAAYTFLLWPCLLSILSVGYTSYRRAHLSLDHKLNFSWSRYYTVLGRRIIQDALGCCGYYSSMHEASPSKGCYLRTPLPGCKAKLFDFERTTLRAIWRTIFSVAPLHILNIVVALLCANHVTYVWGKRVMPKQYRLTPNDVKADAEKLLSGSMYIGEGLEDQMAHLHKS